MTVHDLPPDHDFDPDEQSRWEEYRRSLPVDDPLWLAPLDDLPPRTGTGGRISGLIDWATFWYRDRNDQEWLIEPVLALGRAHSLYAPAKAGKSLLALEIAAAAATGRPVLHQPAGPPRVVLYIDLEMTEDDLAERLTDLGYGPDDDLSNLHYYLLPDLPPLDTPTGGMMLANEAQRIDAKLVVVDTVARSIVGAENDADTIAALARYTFTPLKRAGITSLRVDHSGKDLTKGQRGSSAKNDDVDIVWQLTAGDADTLTLRATHRRLSWVPEVVELTRVADPLRHLTGAKGWPAGTLEAAQRLDDAGAAPDITVRAARSLIGGKNAIVAAAVKYRRLTPEEDGKRVGKHDFTQNGKHPGETESSTPSDLRETHGVTSGNGSPGIGVTVYPPKGVPVPSPDDDDRLDDIDEDF